MKKNTNLFLRGIFLGTGCALVAVLIGVSLVNAQQKTGSPSPVVAPTSSPTAWTAPNLVSAEVPKLEKPTFSSAPRGSYITFDGSNLGTLAGEIIFSNGKEEFTVKDGEYPSDCKKTWWRNNYVLVRVPENLQKGSYKIRVKRSDGVLSNELALGITDIQGGVGICSVTPDNGPQGIGITISGIRFGNQKGKLSFGKNEISLQQSDWSDTKITFVLPQSETQNAKLKIITSQQIVSNQVPFSPVRCVQSLCGIGDACCSDGSCRLKGMCQDRPSLCSYQWSFFTGALAAVGEKCENNAQCISGICGATKVCMRGEKQLNELCRFDGECKEGLSCSGGACKKTLQDVGEKCSSLQECFSNMCINGICGLGSKKIGESCGHSQECSTGNCYKNQCAQGARCLQVEKIEPVGDSIPRNAVFVVTFNQLIDTASAKGKVTLDPSLKGREEFRTIGSGAKAQSQVVFRPSEILSAKKKYRVVVDGEIKAASSDNILRRCVTVSGEGILPNVTSKDCKERAQTTCQKRDGLLYCSDDPTCGNDRMVCSKEQKCTIKDDCKLCSSCKDEVRCLKKPAPPPECKGQSICQKQDGSYFCSKDPTCKDGHLVCKAHNRCTFGDDCKLCKPCTNDSRCRVEDKKDCGAGITCKRPDGSTFCSNDSVCQQPNTLTCSTGPLCGEKDSCDLCAKCATNHRCQLEKGKKCEDEKKITCQTPDGRVYCSDDQKCSSSDKQVCSLGTVCLATDNCSLCSKCKGADICKNVIADCPGKTTCKRTDGSSYCSDDAACGGGGGGATVVCSANYECLQTDSCECAKCKSTDRCKKEEEKKKDDNKEDDPKNLSNEARCVSIDAPDEVTVSQEFNATLKIKNTGTKPWAPGVHKLGSQDPQDNRFWVPGQNRIELTKEVAPQEIVEFSFKAKAYALPMEGPFSWKMVEEKKEWFGEECHKKIKVKLSDSGATCNTNATCDQGETCACSDCKDTKIECKTPPTPDTVWNNAQCDLSLPSKILAGGEFTAQVTLKNTGTKSWLKTSHSLRSENPYENTSWGISKVDLPRDVKPQESVTLSFKSRAFSVNQENFSFQLVEEKTAQKEWFGERCRDRVKGAGLEKPQGLKVLSSSTELKNTVTWTDTNDSEEGYEIQRKRGGSGEFVTVKRTDPNTTTFVDTQGLVASTVYTYRVRAVRSVYTSDFSDEAQGTTPGTTDTNTSLLDSIKVFVEGTEKAADEFTCVSDNCETHTYSVRALAGSVEISPKSVLWSTNDPANISLPDDKTTSSISVSVKGVEFAGKTITVVVKGEQNREYTKTVSISNHPCAHPWSYDALYDMKLYYCAGNAVNASDRLPMLQSVPPTQVTRTGWEEWIFKFTDTSKNNDAIIIRSYQNPEWYSAMRWYSDPQKNHGVGGPASSERDGFAAVTDGAGTYIASVDTTQNPPKPQILYITVNANASPQTKQVYQALLDSVQLAVGVRNTQGADAVEKLHNDVKRIADLQDVAFYLEGYKLQQSARCSQGLQAACAAHYPDLAFGSYKRGQALSSWPLSWTSTLANTLSRGLPQDPWKQTTAFGCTINADGTYTNCTCDTNTFKSDTCWNEAAQTFYKPSGEDAISDPKVHAYSYTFTPRASASGNDGYRLCTRFDYFTNLTGQSGQKYCIIK